MELTDGWQKRYWDYYKAMPDSDEKYQKLKELAETLEEQMRIALRNQNYVNLSKCQSYLHITENAINALSPKHEGWKGQDDAPKELNPKLKKEGSFSGPLPFLFLVSSLGYNCG